jgi:hypothetical protein
VIRPARGRSGRRAVLALVLAGVAGFVDAAGYLSLNLFSAHMSGRGRDVTVSVTRAGLAIPRYGPSGSLLGGSCAHLSQAHMGQRRRPGGQDVARAGEADGGAVVDPGGSLS